MKKNGKYIILIAIIIIALICFVITQIQMNKYSVEDFKKMLEAGIAMDENNYIKVEGLTNGKSQFIHEIYTDGDIIYYHLEGEDTFNSDVIMDFSQNTQVMILHENKNILNTIIPESTTKSNFIPNEQVITALNESPCKIKYCGKTKINNVECLKFCVESKISNEKLKEYCYINSKNKLIVRTENGKEQKIITYENKEINKEILARFDVNNYNYNIAE